MRARTNISRKERKIFAITDFKGVDFSTSPQKVQSNRASDMRNFICEGGVIKKRNGWNQVLGMSFSEVKGFAKYKNSTGKGYYECLLVYSLVKDDLFETPFPWFTYITENEQKTMLYKYTNEKGELQTQYGDGGLIDSRVQFFMNKKRMYIVGCGEYLVYGTWDDGNSYELRRVADDEDTYIPTTTININRMGTENDRRATLDGVNLLCSRRINGLVGDEGSQCVWQLDCTDIHKAKVEIRLKRLVTQQSGKTEIEEKYLACKGDDIESGDIYEYKLGENGQATEDKCDSESAAGYIDWARGTVTLFISTTPPVEGDDNLFVTFYHRNPTTAEERIKNCKFGTLFGINGEANRLFVSGNSDFPNMDFYSEEQDFTYFPDLNYCSVGSDSSAITGYGRLSDSTLAIYKERNAYESSVYVRTGRYDTKYDSDGNIDSMVGVFSHKRGGSDEACINAYACANFDNDTVFLSQNGLFGVVLPENVSSTERYAMERSVNIRERLKKHNLQDAVGIVYKNRYYLAIDGVCYVADSRYKTETADSYSNSYGYEWFFWDSIPANCWAAIDDKLYFGTKDGAICVFDEEYTDRRVFESEIGDISIKTGGFELRYSLCDFLEKNDMLRIPSINNSAIYALIAQEVSAKGDKVNTKSEDNYIFSFFEGDEVYVDGVDVNAPLKAETPYYITDINYEDGTYSLCSERDNTASKVNFDSEIKFNIYQKINDLSLYVADKNEESCFYVKKYIEGKPLTISSYNSATPTTLIIDFFKKNNIVAEWCSPVLDLGSNDMSKTLLKMTVATDPGSNGALQFGYETRTTNNLMKTKDISAFSFNDFSFNSFSFDTGFATSLAVKCNERNFNYIMFKFISDSDSDCRINSFSAIYKFNKSNKGVM